MKLGVNLVYQGAGTLARAAEELGYHIALAPEGYRSDAVSVLGFVAGQTERIGLASGVMQIPARTPAMAALTAATLDALSGGRVRLGLGVSNPDVSEGWYGVQFDQPLRRTREYIEIVRAALHGRPVHYQGRHFQLPSGSAGQAPLHVLTEPIRSDIPIYLAAVGPKNLQLAGEIADGWIGVFTSPEMTEKAVAEIRIGRERSDRDLDTFEIMPCLPTSIMEDRRLAADTLRGQYAYLLGIGNPERNFYIALATQLGFERDVTRIPELVRNGDHAGAAAAVPFDLISETALIGSVDHVAKRMQAYAAAGVTTLGIMVSAAATTTDGRLSILRLAAEALKRSGVASA